MSRLRLALVLIGFPLRSQTVSGDAEAGKALFEGRGACLSCHALHSKGGSVGPELSDIGIRRTPASLRSALIDPGAEILPEYLTTVVTVRNGGTIAGLTLNEDDLSIQLRDSAGELHSVLKEEAESVRREARSLMPSFARQFTEPEFASLIAYLRSLRGEIPAGAVRYTRKLPIGPVAQDLESLDRADRSAEERPESLIEALRIQPGSSIADVGSGTGYFTWRLAKQIRPERHGDRRGDSAGDARSYEGGG